MRATLMMHFFLLLTYAIITMAGVRNKKVEETRTQTQKSEGEGPRTKDFCLGVS